jgi:hypothetical protein
MGVGEPVMTLMRKTSAASIRWLSPAELKDSHLATLAFDAVAPMLTSGANGLNARGFDGDPPRPDLMQASIVSPVAAGAAILELAFRYRRGGAVVEAAAIERSLKAPQAQPFPDLGVALSAPGVEAIPVRIAGSTAAPALIPRERFCALARAGAVIASPASEGSQGLAPVKLTAMDGARTLIAEACP